MYKICSKCKEEKELSFFSKKTSNKDGFRSECKICVKDYRKANKTKISAYAKDYRDANKVKIAAHKKNYREENKDKTSAYDKNYRKSNSLAIAAYAKCYSEANKLKITNQKKEYRKTNKTAYTLYQRSYRLTNKARLAAITAKRRAAKLQATPSWLTKEEFVQIEEMYECAVAFKLYTGEEYHVDHIVPLQGKNVCGLHVPWNLQLLSAHENKSKSNKLLEN
jgi:hypothetical protein